MKHAWRAGLVLAGILLLAGCGDRKHPAGLVGSWKLDLTQGMLASEMARDAPTQRQQYTALLAGATYVFGPKGELTSQRAGARAGTWEVEGERLKISMPQATGAGAPTQQSAPFQLLDGGKTLKMGDPGKEVFWKKQ